MSSDIKPNNLIYLIGPPGAGKGPLGQDLARKLGDTRWEAISVGDEVRDYCKRHGSEDDPVSQAMQKSELVPVEKLADVLDKKIKYLRENHGIDSIILDGFPRHLNQISHFNRKFGGPNRVLYMECSKESSKDRVLSRKFSDREKTDTEENFERRFSEFEANNPDIVAHYEESPGRLIKVNASEFLEGTDATYDDFVNDAIRLLTIPLPE